MRLTDRFVSALTGAVDIHREKLRKDTEVPYAEHVLGVASIVLFHGGTEDEGIGALLHDAIEDAPEALGPDWVRKWIKRSYGDHVLAIVEGCSDTDETPKPAWRARKERYIAHLAHASPSVVLVSAADKLHNATEILSHYRSIGDQLWSRFDPSAGKAGTIGYYRGLVDAYRKLGWHPNLVRDLDEVVKQIEAATEHQAQWPLG